MQEKYKKVKYDFYLKSKNFGDKSKHISVDLDVSGTQNRNEKEHGLTKNFWMLSSMRIEGLGLQNKHRTTFKPNNSRGLELKL